VRQGKGGREKRGIGISNRFIIFPIYNLQRVAIILLFAIPITIPIPFPSTRGEGGRE